MIGKEIYKRSLNWDECDAYLTLWLFMMTFFRVGDTRKMWKKIHIPLNRSVAFNKAISDVTAQFSALLLSCKVHVIYFLHNSLPLETFFFQPVCSFRASSSNFQISHSSGRANTQLSFRHLGSLEHRNQTRRLFIRL